VGNCLDIWRAYIFFEAHPHPQRHTHTPPQYSSIFFDFGSWSYWGCSSVPFQIHKFAGDRNQPPTVDAPASNIRTRIHIGICICALRPARRNSTSHLLMDTDTDTFRATSKINHHRHRRMHFIVRRLRFMKPNFSGWTPTCRMCLHIYFPST